MGAINKSRGRKSNKVAGGRKVGRATTTGQFATPSTTNAAGMEARLPPRGARGGIRPQPYGRAEDVRKRLGFTQQEFADLLGIDPRTYSRRAEGNLKGSESLQVEMLDEALREATRVFRDEELARTWLQSPIIGLDNKRPIDHLDSIEGYERVKDTLGKIEYGMY